MTSVKIDEEGQTSDEICNEQKSGSTPFPQRSSGMAWLRETPIKSVYPTTPGLTTRDSVETVSYTHLDVYKRQNGSLDYHLLYMLVR